MVSSPFVVTVYDKAFTRKGTIGDPSLTVTPRHNLLGTAEVSLRMNHPRAADVLADGARVTIDYHDTQVMSGTVRAWTARGPASASMLTVTIHDDWRLLTRVLGWPLPAAAIGAQIVAYDNRNAAAETVLKGLVTANATSRLGLPVTVATDLARGSNIRSSHRFHPLIDRLDLDAAGIGVTVRQVGAGLVVDCYAPATYPRTLTEASGVVQDWEWTRNAPTATRVVTGNQGEAEARSFVASSDPARETAWADKVEVFIDARDTADTTETAQRMAETLTEGAPKTGLAVTLAETDTFRYGEAVSVGDLVTLQVGTLAPITDVLREATLSWTAEDGLLVSPTVGDMRPPESLLPRALAALRRQVQTLSRS